MSTTSNNGPKCDPTRYEQEVDMPQRLVALKRDIIFGDVDPESDEGKKRVLKLETAWREVIEALKVSTDEIEKEGSNIVPCISLADVTNPSFIPDSTLSLIRKRGVLIIRNVVPQPEAESWRRELEQYVQVNGQQVEGIPEGDKQFFMLYWTRPQVLARAHPNVLAATTWLNSLYRVDDSGSNVLDGVDLSTPLTYADRFRIRHAGNLWKEHPPHIDGGAIERWEDPSFRSCFASILNGSWREHDPYDLKGRLQAKTSMYGRPNQSSVFRTFQGWLALSSTAPTQGTLQVFPNIHLSNAYLMLRPFFRLREEVGKDGWVDIDNWEFDISRPDFPGLKALPSGGFGGPRLTKESHPHLRLDKTMVSVPTVKPGDMVFWHCDVVHAVEEEHKGVDDSAVMYIPSVPLTPQNASYLTRQREAFNAGRPPPDFPQGRGETGFIGIGKEEDVIGEVGRRAMGLAY